MAAVLGDICVLLLLLAVVSSYCPNGWERFDDSCYLYVDIRHEPWKIAKNYCTALDSHLVIVESARENDHIKKELTKLHTSRGDQFWTAGTDMQNESSWVWAGTGDSIEMTFWHQGEPNQSGGEEDCLTFFAQYNFEWNDEHCERSYSFICEQEDPIENIGSIIG